MPTNHASLSMLLSTIRCVNVAAICALAVWHAYAFHLQQAINAARTDPVFEFSQQASAHTATQPESKI